MGSIKINLTPMPVRSLYKKILSLLTALFIFTFSSWCQKTPQELGDSIALAFKTKDFTILKNRVPSVDQIKMFWSAFGFDSSENDLTEIKKRWPKKIQGLEKTFNRIVAEGKELSLFWESIYVDSIAVLAPSADYIMASENISVPVKSIRIYLENLGSMYSIDVALIMMLNDRWYLAENDFVLQQVLPPKKPATINSEWEKLRHALQTRSRMLFALCGELLKNKKTATNELQSCQILANPFNRFLDSIETLTPELIVEIHKRNQQLTICMGHALANSRQNPALNNPNLQTDLMSAENRIYTSIRSFNQVCKASGREDLMFPGKAVFED